MRVEPRLAQLAESTEADPAVRYPDSAVTRLTIRVA